MNDSDYEPSTWCVLQPDGRVEHQPGPASNTAIRKALGGYQPAAINLDPIVDAHVHAWRTGVTVEAEANYPARALLAAWLREPPGFTLQGPVVLSGVDGEGLPIDVLERLAAFDARARNVA